MPAPGGRWELVETIKDALDGYIPKRTTASIYLNCALRITCRITGIKQQIICYRQLAVPYPSTGCSTSGDIRWDVICGSIQELQDVVLGLRNVCLKSHGCLPPCLPTSLLPPCLSPASLPDADSSVPAIYWLLPIDLVLPSHDHISL